MDKTRKARLEKLKRVKPGSIMDMLSEEERKEWLKSDYPEVLGSVNRSKKQSQT